MNNYFIIDNETLLDKFIDKYNSQNTDKFLNTVKLFYYDF